MLAHVVLVLASDGVTKVGRFRIGTKPVVYFGVLIAVSEKLSKLVWPLSSIYCMLAA